MQRPAGPLITETEIEDGSEQRKGQYTYKPQYLVGRLITLRCHIEDKYDCQHCEHYIDQQCIRSKEFKQSPQPCDLNNNSDKGDDQTAANDPFITLLHK